jgi:hypothetical protein
MGVVEKLVKNMGGEGAIRNADDGDCWLSESLLGEDGAADGVEISMGETVAEADACTDCWADSDEVEDDGVGPPEGRDDVMSSSVGGTGRSRSIGPDVSSCGRKVCACADVGVDNEASSATAAAAGRAAESISMADVDDVGGGTVDSASHICSIGLCASAGLST